MVKILKINLQHLTEIDEVLTFNKDNNYEFILQLDDSSNMIDVRCLKKLLQNNYEILSYYGNLEFIYRGRK